MTYSYALKNKLKIENSGWFLIVVLVFYIVVAYNSVGYHHEDEHYQIIEFANFKLGLIPINRLAWEFEAQIRPGLQPLLCYLLFKLFHLVDITDGYTMAFLLRAITGIFSIFAIWKFTEAYKSWICKNLRTYFFLLSYLLWFLPYINVRFSSETWSGNFFLLALAVLQTQRYRETAKKYMLLGALFGVSVLFRYQSCLLVVGIVAWLIGIQKITSKNLLTILFSLLVLLTLGILIDYWLYGKLAFSMYNYFYVNLVKGVSSNYGTSPYYQYLYDVFALPAPFGVLIYTSFFTVLIFNPKNIIIWPIIPFLVIHSVIAHKEFRFLYPIANLAPLLLIFSYQSLYKKWKTFKIGWPVKYALIATFIYFGITNAAGLLVSASVGAGSGKTAVTWYIHKHYDEQKTNIILNGDLNPYMDWGPPKNTFYSSSGLHIERVASVWQYDLLSFKKAGYTNLFVIYNTDISGPKTIDYMKQLGLVKVYENIPGTVSRLYDFYKPGLNNTRITVYEFR